VVGWAVGDFPVDPSANARHAGAQVGELVVELPAADGGLSGGQDPLNWPGSRSIGVRPPVRRGLLVLMTAVCSKTTVGKAVDLLSGPGGLASFLMGRRQLGARLAGPSLPLDIGYAETIPAGILL